MAFVRRRPGRFSNGASSLRSRAAQHPGWYVALVSRIVAVAPVLPARSYGQGEITAALLAMITDDPARQAVMRRIHAASGVETRSLVMPLERYRSLTSFQEANDFFIAEGASLAERAVTQALETAGLTAADVDYLLFTSVTGTSPRPPSTPSWSSGSGCAPTSNACRASDWAVSRARPGWPA